MPRSTDTKLEGSPPLHQAGVSDSGIQPGPKRLRIADALHMLIRLQQGFLHDVFGVLRMAAHQQTKLVGGFLRAHEEPFHRRAIAADGVPHERRVFRLHAGVLHHSIVSAEMPHEGSPCEGFAPRSARSVGRCSLNQRCTGRRWVTRVRACRDFGRSASVFAVRRSNH